MTFTAFTARTVSNVRTFDQAGCPPCDEIQSGGAGGGGGGGPGGSAAHGAAQIRGRQETSEPYPGAGRVSRESECGQLPRARGDPGRGFPLAGRRRAGAAAGRAAGETW